MFLLSREPTSLVKPLKGNASADDENKHNEKLEQVKPKAVRHLILIRHGQYNLNGSNDAQRYLTELGKYFQIYFNRKLGHSFCFVHQVNPRLVILAND